MLAPETVSGFIFLISAHIVVKDPVAIRFPDQMANLVFFIGPKANHPAGIAVKFPEVQVDTIPRIERRNQCIAVLTAALRMTWFARKLDPDSPELTGKNCFRCR